MTGALVLLALPPVLDALRRRDARQRTEHLARLAAMSRHPAGRRRATV